MQTTDLRRVFLKLCNVISLIKKYGGVNAHYLENSRANTSTAAWVFSGRKTFNI